MKLYTVTVEVSALVLAEDEYEAADYADQIVRDVAILSDDASFVTPYGGTLPEAWDEKTLVYHDGEEDITVEQAVALVEAKE